MTMDDETILDKGFSQEKVREKIDFEVWIYEHRLEMTKVQADRGMATYENMLNSLINSLIPYWPEGFEAKWDIARNLKHPDPNNEKNRLRVETKERLMAELIEAMGIGFTRKKKAIMKAGGGKLWELYSPLPPAPAENKS